MVVSVINSVPRAGDPRTEANNQLRGAVDSLFDDGRVALSHIKAVDINDWNAQLAALPAKLEEDVVINDAVVATEPDEPIEPNGYASDIQTCIAYIRTAWREVNAYRAYRYYDKINTWAQNNGGWAAVKQDLLDNGLTEEEYNQAASSYQYLNTDPRPQVMQDAADIQEGWENQHDNG